MKNSCINCKNLSSKESDICFDCFEIIDGETVYKNFVNKYHPYEEPTESNEKPVDAPRSSIDELRGVLLDSIETTRAATDKLKTYLVEDEDTNLAHAFIKLIDLEIALEKASYEVKKIHLSNMKEREP